MAARLDLIQLGPNTSILGPFRLWDREEGFRMIVHILTKGACVANNGEEHEQTISAGNNYALRLLINNDREMASELLTNLLATSKKVLGSHHNITKRIESTVGYL